MSWTITNLSLTREDPLRRTRRSPLSRAGRVMVGSLRIAPGRSATISDAVYRQFERRILEYRGAGMIRVTQSTPLSTPSAETAHVPLPDAALLPAAQPDTEAVDASAEEAPVVDVPAEDAPILPPAAPVDEVPAELPDEEEEGAKPRRKARAPKVAA